MSGDRLEQGSDRYEARTPDEEHWDVKKRIEAYEQIKHDAEKAMNSLFTAMTGCVELKVEDCMIFIKLLEEKIATETNDIVER